MSRPTHLIADLEGCDPAILDDEATIRAVMIEAAARGGATVVDANFHRFDGGGITGVVMVKESHLTVHTWPERGYAALDVFLCGRARPRKALRYVVKQLAARRSVVREHVRGEGEAPAPPAPAQADVPRPGPRAPVRRGEMAAVYALTLVVAMCSILYELLLAQTLSALLGNTVLRYSLTIGCYLGALGVGAMLCPAGIRDPVPRLIRVELALSAIGGLSVPLFYFFDMLQRYAVTAGAGSPWQAAGPILFAVATFGVIIVIGLLSGFEVPLLLAMGDRARPRSAHKVLGVDYFGALVGSVLFPLVLLRSIGLLRTAFIVGLLNVGAALALIAWRPPARRLPAALTGVAVTAVLAAALGASGTIEQYFLKKFYFYRDAVSLSSLIAPQPERPEIVRYRSAYQTIDLVRARLQRQWLYDRLSTPPPAADDPRDLWVYLNRDYQLYAGSEEIYHEWFVHAAVQAGGRPPRRVLVLGGGDGLAIREILKYRPVRVVHVEIDPEMLRLAREHPELSALSRRGGDWDVVEEVEDDAFRWLRTSDDRFDAIYVDFPAARDYNLAVLYSREFYSLVRHHLEPGGFVAIDTPNGSCVAEPSLWETYYSTLRAAGFDTVVPYVSHLNLDGRRIGRAIDDLAAQSTLAEELPDGSERQLDYDERRRYLRRYYRQELESALQEFTLAFRSRRTPNTRWLPFDVPLRVFGPSQLPAAFATRCPEEVEPALVNSIFRPTLPELAFLNVRFP